MSHEQKEQIKQGQLNNHTQISSQQIAQWQAVIASQHIRDSGGSNGGSNNGNAEQRVSSSANAKVKQALSSYMFFLKEQRQLISEKIPEGNVLMKELVRVGAQVWGQMTEQQKQPYKIMQEIDKLKNENEFNGPNQNTNAGGQMEL